MKTVYDSEAEKGDPTFRDWFLALMSWGLFCLVTIFWSCIVFIASVLLYPFDQDRKAIHFFISLWAKSVLVVCPYMKLEFQGKPLPKDKAYVFIANHQSLLDIIVVLHMPNAFKFIAKKELFWIPFLGWSLWCAGYISLNRSDKFSGRQALTQAGGLLDRGASVLLFPEGTRSVDGQIKEFKIGAFKLAQMKGVPVVPIVICGTNEVIEKGSPIIRTRRKVVVQFSQPRIPHGAGKDQIKKFSELIRKEMMEQLSKIRGEAGHQV
jgi:1-acyl-sn-glycerol-3-phosphate acyltransferase